MSSKIYTKNITALNLQNDIYSGRSIEITSLCMMDASLKVKSVKEANYIT